MNAVSWAFDYFIYMHIYMAVNPIKLIASTIQF